MLVRTIAVACVVVGSAACGGDPSATPPPVPDAAPVSPVVDAGGASLDAVAPDVHGQDAVASGGQDAPSSGGETSAPESGTTPARVYGVTVDDVSNASEIVTALSALPHRPTARVVFDEGQPPSAYAQAVPAVHAVADVMGEILDSEYVDGVTVAQYTQRTSDYLAALAGTVDVWEVGNEINGNWVGTSGGGTADVVAKIGGAFDLVKAAGGRTALTLYGCSDSDAAHDPFVWADANVPQRMRTGLDWVLVSYYEGDCGAPRSDWPTVFQTLHQMFPGAAVGFGEVGAVDANGNDVTDPAVAGPYLQKYYGMAIAEPGYVGGWFWWYFAEDMVPDSKPMFAVLAAAMK